MTEMKNKKCLKTFSISCEWENCKSSMTLITEDYELFSDHLKVHADDFVLRLKNEAGNSKNLDERPIYCCCMWKECSWEGCEDLTDLVRHIMAHGYHSLLKALGKLVQTKLNLSACTIEVEDPYHMLSCISKPFICCWKECNTEYLCPNNFYRHVEQHVAETDSSLHESGSLKKQCFWTDCTNQFRDKHKLKEHMRVHTHEKIFACPGCGGLFSNRTKLLDHLSRQNIEAYDNFQCSHCLKRCASERLLRDHMRHHVNYLKCPHCDMTCPNPGSLKYHIQYRHSNDRPYSCAMCEQGFKSNSDLIRHEESHLQKCYVCHVDGCSYSTKTSHCMRRHIKMTHSGNTGKRYVCHVCNQTYSRGFGLTKHLKKKHNFSWPSGHPRFRYIEYEDGLFRLQMVRFESAELTERLSQQENGDQQTSSDSNEEDKDVGATDQYENKEFSEDYGPDFSNTISIDAGSISTSTEEKFTPILVTENVGELHTTDDASVMSQLNLVSSKPNLQDLPLADSALVTSLYRKLKKATKAAHDTTGGSTGHYESEEAIVARVENIEENSIRTRNNNSEKSNAVMHLPVNVENYVNISPQEMLNKVCHSKNIRKGKKKRIENSVDELSSADKVKRKDERCLIQNVSATDMDTSKCQQDLERDQKWDASQVLLSFTHGVKKEN